MKISISTNVVSKGPIKTSDLRAASTRYLTENDEREDSIKPGDSIEFLSDRLTDKGPCTTKVSKVSDGKFVAYFDGDDSSVVVNIMDEINNMKCAKPGLWQIK